MTFAGWQITGWRDRAYRDRDEDPGALDWADPVERLAAFLYALRYETPEVAHGAVVGRYPGLAETWGRVAPVDRQLWRRRAALAIDVAAVSA